ncbi:unnamed protein product [Arctia plantaginis]|uniref:HTH CENPB-type domain-containing protein n=1 Tax=Arctia plantaginis TaxID=874455 RepID=A0A8S1B0H4_ARCPL|nr:unnamed protein product [Arctia plantaginis]
MVYLNDRMPGKNGAFLNYTEAAMLAAVNDVHLHKTPIRTAAKKFGVPRITLTNKVKGKSPMERKMDPTSILTPEEEHKICDWVQKMAKAGFPETTEQLIVSVEKYLKELKRPCVLFKHGRPGRTWVKAFIRRNPTISMRISQNLTASRARVTGAHLSEWYKRVYKELEDSGHADILNDASRIFNCDETACFLAPKGPKVLARKGEKNVYQQVNADDKECLTVLVTGNANGSLAPTTVLFSYKRIPQEIADNFPSDWEGVESLGVSVEDASASNNNNGVLETTMETTATALPNTVDDNIKKKIISPTKVQKIQ